MIDSSENETYSAVAWGSETKEKYVLRHEQTIMVVNGDGEIKKLFYYFEYITNQDPNNNEWYKRNKKVSTSSIEVKIKYGNRKENTDLEAFTAAQYSTEFMGTYTSSCDSTGQTPVNPSDLMWSVAASQFALLSTADQNTIKTASADNAGSIIEQVASRYDTIIAKYGSETINNFMGRSASQGLVNSSLFAMNSETSTAIIVVIAVASISAIGAIFFIRRRKYN